MSLEELQAQVLEMQETQKTIIAENTSMKQQLEDKTKREKELEEHNQKLWLKVTSSKEDTTEEKDNIPSFIDEKVYKLLDNNDKKILKEIMEEE